MERCGYCGSNNVDTDSYGKYSFEGKEYDYEIIICNEENNGCEHSWTLIGEMPEKARELLLSDLEKEFN